MSLLETYKSRISNYGSQDADWVHFVRDNQQAIIDSSTWYELDPYKLNTLKYRLEDFLVEENILTSVAWIVIMINQLGSNADFIGLSRIRLPNMDFISELRTQYNSLVANFRIARE